MFGDDNVKEAYEREVQEIEKIERPAYDAQIDAEQWEIPEGFGDEAEQTAQRQKTAKHT